MSSLINVVGWLSHRHGPLFLLDTIEKEKEKNNLSKKLALNIGSSFPRWLLCSSCPLILEVIYSSFLRGSRLKICPFHNALTIDLFFDSVDCPYEKVEYCIAARVGAHFKLENSASQDLLIRTFLLLAIDLLSRSPSVPPGPVSLLADLIVDIKARKFASWR